MSKEPKEGVIRIVPASESGVSDGVEMMAQTAMAIFEQKDGKVVGIGNIGNLPCKMMASYETGTFSVSVRDGFRKCTYTCCACYSPFPMLASAIFQMEIGGNRRLVCQKAKQTDGSQWRRSRSS